MRPSTAKTIIPFLALLIGGCNDDGARGSQGLPGVQGPQGNPGLDGVSGEAGPAGIQGIAGPPGPPGPGSVGTAYVIPGSGGSQGGGYLVLTTPSSRASLYVTCNYSLVGDNEAFWFAGSGVSAGSIAIINQLDGEPLQAFNDLETNQGGQDRATRAGNPQLGSWPWHGVFTANDGGTLTRWDVTTTGSPGGDCTALVYAYNGGTADVVQP